MAFTTLAFPNVTFANYKQYQEYMIRHEKEKNRLKSTEKEECVVKIISTIKRKDPELQQITSWISHCVKTLLSEAQIKNKTA